MHGNWHVPAVVLSVAEYGHLRNEEDFKAFLRSAPDLDLEIDRSVSPARPLGLGEGDSESDGS